ncbi:hypothetical protein SDJN02_07676, partial [Cucurbita argyrosperma subsp. argyrosperma]
MFPSLYFFCLVGFLVLDGLCSTPQTNETHLRCSGDHPKRAVKMGVIADNSSRVGREQIVAIHMAFKQYPLFSNSCHKVEVKAMIGTLTREEVSSIFELHKASKNIPIISLSSASIVPPPTKQIPTSFLQMANDITQQI